MFDSYFSQALHSPLLPRSEHGGLIKRVAIHVPKPMFEFAFEGALLAFTLSGDRLLLLALLPRIQPRTDKGLEVQLPYRFKDLNLTTPGYSDSLAP